MDAKTYFRQIKKNVQKCIWLDILIKDNKGIMQDPTFKNDGFLIERLKSETAELEQEKSRCLKQSEQVKAFIMSLKIKDDIKDVLILRFIKLKKIKEIADIMYFSISYVNQLIRHGLYMANEIMKFRQINLDISDALKREFRNDFQTAKKVQKNHLKQNN